VKSGKKKSGQSLSKSQSKASPPEIASPNSASGSIGKDDKKKSKKKSKKIKRIRKSGSEGTDSGEDEYTVISKQSTKSNKSSKSSKSSDSLRSKVSKASRYNKNAKNRLSKQYKETSSRVEAIREPILSSEGVIIKDELDNLFPLPMSPGSKLGKVTRSASSGKNNGVESTLNSDADDGLNRSSHKPKPQSQRNIGIMTNKAAEEQAEAALNRVAAQQQMDTSNDTGSFASGEHRPFGRRYSNGSTRSREQYQRLQRDSGTSLTSVNDHDDDAKSFSSRRSQSNLTAMSALHKRMDEYKVETDNLQKRLYEALAEVEQSNIILRRQKERADKAEGDLSEVKEDLECVQDEKSFLIESIRDMETEFSTKDERVEKLQEVAETQLDTVEFLEDKLNKTEEELVLMEKEMNELILVVEEKNKTEEQINEVKSKGQGRVARMTSMREEMDSRKGSIRMQKEESRRVLLLDPSKSADRSRAKSVMKTLDENQDDMSKLEHEMKTRDDDLKAKEQRLDKWERDLFDLEDQLKRESSKINGADKEKSPNSENEALIASLEQEKEKLRRNQIDSKSKLKKLEFENEDLRIKLDRFTKMMTDSSKGFPAKNGDLSDALSLVDEKK
jgi:DNA repair exonuclease SbcCD ATPase subunit